MKRLTSLLVSVLFFSSPGMLFALPYQLALQPPASGRDVFVSIEVPVGLTPSGLSHGGVFDSGNRLMKWGPLQVAEVSSLGFELTSGVGSLAIVSYPSDATDLTSLTVQGDSDGDGLSNDFEATYSVTDPSADDDDDGFDNLTEQNLGTNPRDAASRLYARSVVENSSEELLVIRIPAELGTAGLRVETSPSLADALWRGVPFVSRLDGDEIVVEVELSRLTGSKNFFRVLR